MKSHLILLILWTFFVKSATFETPNAPVFFSYNANTSTLQIKGQYIKSDIPVTYIWTYNKNDEQFVSETTQSNILSLICGNQICNSVNITYLYKTDFDISPQSLPKKIYCGNKPNAPISPPEIISNTNNMFKILLKDQIKNGGLPSRGYILYMKYTFEEEFGSPKLDLTDQPDVNTAIITYYRGSLKLGISYDIAYSSFNPNGEGPLSPILSVIPKPLPNLANSIITGSALEQISSNSDVTLTVSTYDDKNTPINYGGSYYMLDIRDYCIQNTRNQNQCDRVNKNDPNYIPETIGLPLNKIFNDLNNGQYNTIFSIPSEGMFTLSIFQLYFGGLRGDYYYDDSLENFALTQVDADLNKLYNSAQPSNYHSVRWEGGFISPTLDSYKFTVKYKGLIKIWINNKVVVDVTQVGNNKAEFILILIPDNYNSIKIESSSKDGNIGIKLKWKADSIKKQSIPSNLLYNYNGLNGYLYKPIQVKKGISNDFDVLIIGAGISGIGCAMKLKEKNIKYKILEARNRIGGRMYTEEFGGKKVNLGASFIYGKSMENPIYQLVQKYHMKFRDNSVVDSGNVYTYYNNGITISPFSKEITNLATQYARNIFKKTNNEFAALTLKKADFCKKEEEFSVQEAFDAAVNADQTVKEFLKDTANNQFWQLLIWAKEQEESNTLPNLSLLPRENNVKYPGGEGELEDGYGTLAEYLSQDLNISTNTIVKSIEDYNTTKIKVITNQGNFTANKVVITVPLGVLKSGQIKFAPNLPKWKKDPIENLQMGTLNKLYIRFQEKFWIDLAQIRYFSSEKGEFPWIDLYSENQKIFIIWLSGEFGRKMEDLEDLEIVNRVIAILGSIYDKSKLGYVEYKVTRWAKDPYSYGAYSSFSRGMKKIDNEVLGTPLNNLHFCGEATNGNYLGTVQGALVSGYRVANEILKN